MQPPSRARHPMVDAHTRLEPASGRGAEIFDELEAPNWPPWLRFSAEELDAQAEVFPRGQILVCDERSRPLASLSSNRIDWDGVIEHLPTWDRVAGDDRTYRDTYRPDGNAVVLMSTNVRPDAQGLGLSEVLIDRMRSIAVADGVEHVMSDFRPNGYGAYKRTRGTAGFAAYCHMTREDGLPVDGWLRSVARKGMQPLAVDPRAIVVHTSASDLVRHRATYRPGRWYEPTDPDAVATALEEHTPHVDLDTVDEVWECDETGTWYVDRSRDRALYIESNLWGRLPNGDP